jgi:hypothetical protein
MCVVTKRDVTPRKREVKREDEVYVRFKPIPQEEKPCDLDFAHIDEIDERGYGESLVLIYCRAHGKWESKWVDDSYL